MAQPIVMPSMGMYTDEGVLTAWLRPSGSRVEKGEPVAEITTEKVTFEVASSTAGILHHAAEVGTSLRVEQLLGYILTDGEVLSAQVESARTAAPEPENAAPKATVVHENPRDNGSLRASPVARRLASQHDIDLSDVKGSGPGGRIVEADVFAEVARRGKKGGPKPEIASAEEE